MTSKTSSAIKTAHPSLGLYRFTLRKSFGLICLLCVGALVLSPGLTLTTTLRQFSFIEVAERDTFSITSAFIGFATVITTLATLLMCLFNFNFLYSRKASDMYFALPLTRNNLFLSRWIASLMTVFLPMVLAYGGMFLTMRLSGGITHYSFLGRGFVLNLLVMFSMSTFFMIFVIGAGAVFDMFLSAFFLTICPIFLGSIGLMMAEDIFSGFSATSEITKEVLRHISPIMYAFFSLEDLLDCDLGCVLNWNQVAVLFLLGIFFLLVSIVLFRYRKSEKAGESYAWKIFFFMNTVVASTLAAWLCGSIFSSFTYFSASFWCFGLVAALLTAIALSAIAHRGFRGVWKAILPGFLGFTVLVIAALTMIFSAPRYYEKTPNPNQVSSVVVDAYGITMQPDISEIDRVISLQKDCISLSQQDSTDNLVYIEFSYTLKNGKVLARQYDVPLTAELSASLGQLWQKDTLLPTLLDNIGSCDEIEVYSYYSPVMYNTSEDEARFALSDAVIDCYFTPTNEELSALLSSYIEERATQTTFESFGEGILNIYVERTEIHEVSGKEIKNSIYEGYDLPLLPGYTRTISILLEMAESNNENIA